MKRLVASLCAALLLALVKPALAFQEYPSLEVAPYAGYLLYDGDLTTYTSNLALGLRLDLRTFALLGFQFHYARSASTADFPGVAFGEDDYVERIQLNLTRDLLLSGGVFVSGYAGVGSFNRYTKAIYNNDPSVQAGLGFRRNLVGPFYLRGDLGWTGAFLKDRDPDSPFAERSLTHHLDAALTFSVLFDN
ncbi:hypothetical protein FJ251_04920 [bacterium]|nr:hypothetical protein [bacterium]